MKLDLLLSSLHSRLLAIQCLQPTQDITTYGIQLATLCNEAYGSLSALSYTNISYLTTPTSSNLATVSLQIFSLNPLTGALTPVSSSSNYAPSYNATTGVCSNALNYLNLTFLYQGGGQGQNPMTISQVEISVVITSLLNTDPSFSQFVRVGFVQQQPPGVPPLITQQLSGAPGYLTGFPLLVSY